MSKAALKRVQARYPECTHLRTFVYPDRVSVHALREKGPWEDYDDIIASAEGLTLSAAVAELCRVPTVFDGIRRARATRKPDPVHEHPDPWAMGEGDLWGWEFGS